MNKKQEKVSKEIIRNLYRNHEYNNILICKLMGVYSEQEFLDKVEKIIGDGQRMDLSDGEILEEVQIAREIMGWDAII